jgi:hypothetical protein
MGNPLIREIEQEVLDKEHLQHHLLRLPEDVAIARLLQYAGDVVRSRPHGDGDVPPLALLQIGSLLFRALSHCLRWVCTECAPGESVLTRDWEHEQTEADALLRWGMQYAQLATDHIAWSRSFIEASIDSDNQVITFHPPANLDMDCYRGQALADIEWWTDELVTTFPNDAFVRLFNEWQREGTTTPNGIQFQPSFVRRHPEFQSLVAWMSTRLFPELPSDCSLGEYSVQDLRLFYSALYTTCLCVTTVEDEVDRHLGPEARFCTWVMQLPQSQMMGWLVEATGLSREVVKTILADMTFNPSRFYASITATPFVRSRRGTVFLLPRLFAALSPQRTFATALTSGSGRRAYDRIAETLQRHHLASIAQYLRQRGLTVFCEKTVILPDSGRITPDFIITDPSTPNVVVADFKNALAATAVDEVVNRVREYTKGVKQVERYLDCFRRYPQLVAPFYSPARPPPQLHGLVLFRVPMPLPVEGYPSIRVDNWFSVRHRLDTISALVAASLLPPARIDAIPERVTFEFRPILVGKWTYQRSVMRIG